MTVTIENVILEFQSYFFFSFHFVKLIIIVIYANYKERIINNYFVQIMDKSVYQAEIDAACEVIDFLRYNV